MNYSLVMFTTSFTTLICIFQLNAFNVDLMIAAYSYIKYNSVVSKQYCSRVETLGIGVNSIVAVMCEPNDMKSVV